MRSNITLHITIYMLKVNCQRKQLIRITYKFKMKEVKRRVKHYNLEMIIAVGYRVRSHRGTQFRQWAILNE
ncbi:RhuM family protein [Bhargavaea cecembensis]|uniref:RhuM family protein n=1 Tax=Bhargavaea cecembensis TaxID=394098 RepID=UPI0027BAF381|nr:RhuM family protein [Bhargavaea cecembensis]